MLNTYSKNIYYAYYLYLQLPSVILTFTFFTQYLKEQPCSTANIGNPAIAYYHNTKNS
jgi:hypothetical protein